MAICNPLLKNCQQQVTDPQAYTQNVLQTVFSLFMIIGVVYFIWHFVFAALHLMESSGDAKKVEDAKTEITSSFLGLVIVFSVFTILKIAGTLLGIEGLESLKITLPSL